MYKQTIFYQRVKRSVAILFYVDKRAAKTLRSVDLVFKRFIAIDCDKLLKLDKVYHTVRSSLVKQNYTAGQSHLNGRLQDALKIIGIPGGFQPFNFDTHMSRRLPMQQIEGQVAKDSQILLSMSLSYP